MIVCCIAICKSQMVLSHSVTTIISQLGLERKAAMQSCIALYYLQPKWSDSVVAVIHCVSLVIWIVAL